MKRLKPLDLTFGAIFVCLMAIGANITVFFPILAIPIGGATVPLSFQTFFALLAGLMLGKKIGTFAMFTYILIGTAGLPVFSGLQGGLFSLISPTGGFIISFIFVTYAAGWIREKFKKDNLLIYIFAAFVGVILNYGIGVSYMYLATNTWLGLEIPYLLAWGTMVPFLIKDTGLSILAAFFMVQFAKRIPAVWLQVRA